MSQTANGQDISEKKPQKDNQPLARTRPGQRQRERMQRLARRRKRQRIIGASIAAFLLIALGITLDVIYQNYNAQQEAIRAHATATADAHVTATSVAIANATATVVTKNCFLSPDGEAVPAIYTAKATPTAGPTTAPPIKGNATTLKDGLKYVDMKVGSGPALKVGQTVTVNYTGWLASTCQKFDSSYDPHGSTPAGPATFPLAQGNLIPGWIEGLPGMKAGGIRRLYIPAALGYGAQAQGPIPANSNLIFDVQLISFK